MQNLIPVVNKLQDVFNAIGNAPIDLPQIVVRELAMFLSFSGGSFKPPACTIGDRLAVLGKIVGSGKCGRERLLAERYHVVEMDGAGREGSKTSVLRC
eukprot:scaffold1239_cov175-Pinguiococcus_pyrenoidosus.AAC.45